MMVLGWSEDLGGIKGGSLRSGRGGSARSGGGDSAQYCGRQSELGAAVDDNSLYRLSVASFSRSIGGIFGNEARSNPPTTGEIVGESNPSTNSCCCAAASSNAGASKDNKKASQSGSIPSHGQSISGRVEMVSVPSSFSFNAVRLSGSSLLGREES